MVLIYNLYLNYGVVNKYTQMKQIVISMYCYTNKQTEQVYYICVYLFFKQVGTGTIAYFLRIRKCHGKR